MSHYGELMGQSRPGIRQLMSYSPWRGLRVVYRSIRYKVWTELLAEYVQKLLRRRLLLPGPVLMGFADLYDAAYGNPCPPDKMPVVTPTLIGGVALPFPCPHCGATLDWA